MTQNELTPVVRSISLEGMANQVQGFFAAICSLLMKTTFSRAVDAFRDVQS